MQNYNKNRDKQEKTLRFYTYLVIKDRKSHRMNRKRMFSGETTDTFSSAITKLSSKSLRHESPWQPPQVITTM